MYIVIFVHFYPRVKCEKDKF